MKTMARFPLARGLLCTATLSLSAIFPTLSQGRDLTASSYIIIDHTSGHVLDALNPQKKLPVASLTKIATATVVLDWSHASSQSLDQMAVVPSYVEKLPFSSKGVGLAPGDRASLRDLLYAALLQSDNIAAETLANHVGQALAERSNPPPVCFVAQMNALAHKLGMSNTRFLNPHGLDTLERRQPYSTAADIAKLSAYSMSNSAFRFLVSQRERRITVQKADGSTQQYRLQNTNELLGQGAIDGVKTGTTEKAGQCLVISAARSPEVKKDGETFYITPQRLEVVVLGSENRFAEASQLLKQGWQLFESWVAEGRPEQSQGRMSDFSNSWGSPTRR